MELESSCNDLALHACASPIVACARTLMRHPSCLLSFIRRWKLCLMHAVAHVKSGAVTGLEARLALQKGREEAQRLLKLASTALQQQQQLPRSASFPPKGRQTPIGQTPIGPTPHNAQVSACSYHTCTCSAPYRRCSGSPAAMLMLNLVRCIAQVVHAAVTNATLCSTAGLTPSLMSEQHASSFTFGKNE